MTEIDIRDKDAIIKEQNRLLKQLRRILGAEETESIIDRAEYIMGQLSKKESL